MTIPVSNTSILQTRDGHPLIFSEGGTGRFSLILTDEGGQVVQASQLITLKLWLYLRDDTTAPVGGIDSVNGTNILNDGTRGIVGNSKAVTGGSLSADYAVRLTVSGHGYTNGDLVAVRNVSGLRGANGDWPIYVVDANTIELTGSVGAGTWSSGGLVTKGLHVTILPADNVLVHPTTVAVGAVEWHEAYILGTYGTNGSLPIVIQFPVMNLGKA